MKIAQVAPLYESVPPKAYGGTERIVDYLSTELIKLGHDVTVFATADSHPQARLIPCCDQGIRLENALISDMAEHLSMLEMVREMEEDYDIIHFHTDLIHMPFFTHCPDKTLTTLHGRLDLKGLQKFYNYFMEFPLISISLSQRRPVPTANWAGNIYHGIPAHLYRFTPENRQDYLAFLGRFAPEKGAHHAIDIAYECDMPLRMAAKICRDKHIDESYYENVIAPQLYEPFVDYVGEITEDEKSDFLGGARALLMPVEWPEPFGLAMIEAMACGTPVIAFRHGSVPEIIEDGITGFIVDTPDEAVAAVRKVGQLDRQLIRQRFEEKFSAPVMALNYHNLYTKMLDQQAAGKSIPAGILSNMSTGSVKNRSTLQE
jgi:glycosyltransferase involved in cell wall biosynthesis